jgi:DNA-binding winged helix-turn-helix (wHTH) protein
VTVARARAALGPAAGLVATVPRRGYRLTATPIRGGGGAR